MILQKKENLRAHEKKKNQILVLLADCKKRFDRFWIDCIGLRNEPMEKFFQQFRRFEFQLRT